MTNTNEAKPVNVLSAEVMITTAFQDADPMGVVYHGNYFRFFLKKHVMKCLKKSVIAIEI